MNEQTLSNADATRTRLRGWKQSILNPFDVGSALKRLRGWKQMSIRDVAAKAGCSRAVISKIELNQISPTVRTLEKICAALEVALHDFLRPTPTFLSKPVIIPADRQGCLPAMTWWGAKLFQVLPEERVNFTALLLRLDPGGSTSVRNSVISHHQLCFVMQGEVTLNIEGISYPIRTGEGICYNARQSHEWVNRGQTAAELLSVNPYHFSLFEHQEEKLLWRLRRKQEKRKKSRLAAP